MLKTYKIPVIWQVAGLCEIKAESLDKAIETAIAGFLPDKGEYISDSFEIDYDGIPYQNRDLPVDESGAIK